jgi:DNA-binding cell septation regulator SpoVG
MKRKEEINKMRDFEVVNARSWKDKNGKETVFFTMRLEVNGLDIVFYDLTVVEGKKGDFIATPSKKGKDGKYYSIYFLNLTDEEQADIMKQIEGKLE